MCRMSKSNEMRMKIYISPSVVGYSFPLINHLHGRTDQQKGFYELQSHQLNHHPVMYLCLYK